MNRKSMLKRASVLLLISSLSGATLVAQASQRSLGSPASTSGAALVAQAATRVFLPLVANFAPAVGVTFTVNSTADVSDAKTGDGKCETAIGNNVCTLRAAVREANSSDGPNTVILPAGTYVLSLPGPTYGDLDISQGQDLTIIGAGATSSVIQAVDNLNERIFDISAGTTVNISGVTIRNGRAINVPGGGIYNKGVLTLRGVDLRDNSAVRTSLQVSGDGGGIRNNGTLAIYESSITNNSGYDDGGGILNNGRMTLVNVTVANNRAVGEQGGVSDGGGISNQVSSSVPGGAIAEITNSTIVNNSAVNSGGGIKTGSSASMTLRNTIVAFNTDATANGTRNCSGPIVSGGGNLDNGNTCKFTGPSDKINTDPLLKPLSNYGGTTLTRALNAGSPAIDGGVSQGCPATDQRGVARSGACDTGAYEYP